MGSEWIWNTLSYRTKEIGIEASNRLVESLVEYRANQCIFTKMSNLKETMRFAKVETATLVYIYHLSWIIILIYVIRIKKKYFIDILVHSKIFFEFIHIIHEIMYITHQTPKSVGSQRTVRECRVSRCLKIYLASSTALTLLIQRRWHHIWTTPDQFDLRLSLYPHLSTLAFYICFVNLMKDFIW